ncbi:MAG: hypothetical protein EHM48_00675 [Planctomycetaceae bacterium]|nr:MAG: hypothetical protein EHM48_00675 [Planctomycetaceae bacterium]
MDFLRKNMFYVSLASSVLAAFVLTMIIGSSKGDETAASVATRKALQEKMMTVTVKPLINKTVLTDERERNDKLRQQASGSMQISIQHNCEKLTNKDDKSSPLLRYSSGEPVFPLDRESLKGASTYNLITRYQNQLKSLTTQLRPITPYTAAELEREIIRQSRLLGSKRPATETPAVGGAAAGAGPAITEESKIEGIRVMRLKTASKGNIYVKEDALDPLISGSRSSISPAELWWMQINLWIQSDIIAAIAETNSNKGDVTSSPVKHLIKIKIDDKYVGGKSVGITTGGVAAPVGVSPVPVFSPAMPYDPTMSGEGATGSTTIDAGASLTNRTSNKNYDVVRYTLTVVMPTRYIAQLQWNLMARNYHTVLNVSDISEVKDDPAIYYGNEPVMKVTIEGEALFLTAWERGTVDPKDPAKFIYPPLMPVEILKTLPQTALRPEDSDRINKSDAAPK